MSTAAASSAAAGSTPNRATRRRPALGLPRIRSLRAALLPLLAAASLTYATWHVTTSAPATPQTVPVVEPPHAPFAASVAGAGLVEPLSENISVAAIVSGTVAEVAAHEGDVLQAGDVLFRLDDRQLRAELAVQQSRLAAARAELARWQQMPRPEDLPPSEARIRRMQSDVTLRADQLHRAKELFPQRVITEQELVEREQAYNAAVADLNEAQADDARLRAGAWAADLAVAQAQVEQAQQMVEQARVELERLVIRAPIGGTVLKVDVRPGEYVGTPPGKSLVVLGDLSTLHVRVDIDENDLPRFRPGMPGKGFVRGDAETPLPLRFVRVEPYTEPKQSLTGAGNERIDTRVLQVIYEIADPNAAVYVGQQIDVYLDAVAVK